jgi:hypothetical protein
MVRTREIGVYLMVSNILGKFWEILGISLVREGFTQLIM